MSIPGWLISAVMLLPALLAWLLKPAGSPARAPGRQAGRAAAWLERLGAAAVLLGLCFYQLELVDEKAELGLIQMILPAGVYYLAWGRYFYSRRAYRLLFEPLLGFPLPLVFSALTYFLAAGIVLGSLYVLAAAVILAAAQVYTGQHSGYASWP